MYLKHLENINNPTDLKKLSYFELSELANEIRAKIVAVTSMRGGHLASSLGSVELIIAAHRVLDCPSDRIVFDVGHQAYAHKLLTGRYKDFDSLRTLGGISAFPRIDESPFDSTNAGHASDSISSALGYTFVRDLNDADNTVVVMIGDASISGGLAFEGLNQLVTSQKRLIIVLNDNGMSISNNVGGLATYLTHARMSSAYLTVRDRAKSLMVSIGPVGRFIARKSSNFKESIKQIVLPDGMLFEDFGLTYLGPIDGHNISEIEAVMRNAKKADGPVLIHAVTKKGKGYKFAEKFPEKFHGVSKFDIRTGEIAKKETSTTWTSVFSDELKKLASYHDDVIAITAAMSEGTGLDSFKKHFPDRFIDVGISEEHAVVMAGTIAQEGKVPFVAIYSTFLQRAFDQMMINVALQNQHVIFCIDRAGLVGEDGATHHGAFDLSYMRCIPNMTILSPSDELEFRECIHYAYNLDGPVAIRYARGECPISISKNNPSYKTGARELRFGADVSILSVGRMVQYACEAADILKSRGIDASVYDMRFVKPIDASAIHSAAKAPMLVTLEDNSIVGGFGSAVLEALALDCNNPKVLNLGLPDDFVEHGSVQELFKCYKLDPDNIVKRISRALKHL